MLTTRYRRVLWRPADNATINALEQYLREERVGRGMHFVLAIAGTAGFVVSSATALISRRFPAFETALQDWAGGLVIGSAILMIFGFPLM